MVMQQEIVQVTKRKRTSGLWSEGCKVSGNPSLFHLFLDQFAVESADKTLMVNL